MKVLRPVVKPGQTWESRDTRDYLRGPNGSSRQVVVQEVLTRHVVVRNVVTGRVTTIKTVIFASRRSRGGFRMVKEAPSEYQYRIVGPSSFICFKLSRAMKDAGYRLQRKGPVDGEDWEDVIDG